MTAESKLPLRTGSGWKEVRPRPTGWRIAWESGGRLRIASTDFAAIRDGGPVGPVDSPLAFDPDEGWLYRYVCPAWSSERGGNGIARVAPGSGAREIHFPLHPLRWVPWLLQKVPGKPLLVGLVVTDASRSDRPGVILRHQIGLFHTAERRSLYRPLPAGCQHPVAAATENDRLLFHGPDGYQIVDLRGRRQLLLGDPAWGDGRGGGAFRPARGEFAIGGPPLALYRMVARERVALAGAGAFPAWVDAGRGLFFAENSGHLALLDPESGKREDIVSIPANSHPEWKRARPATASPDERYFALPLTRRAPFHAETVRADQPSWSERQTLVIGDRHRKELWQHTGPVHQCAWAGEEE